MAKENEKTTRLVGRDARTGSFVSVKEARERPSTHVVERIPKPGYGDDSAAIVHSTAATYHVALKRLAKK